MSARRWTELPLAARERVLYVIRLHAGYCDEAAAKYNDASSDLRRAALDEAEGFRAVAELLAGLSS